MIRLAALLLAVTLVACAVPRPQLPVKEITAPFDEVAVAKAMAEGTNTVKGSALMRQRGGGVVTCAGQLVRLVPATDYARQRFYALFNTNESGVNQSRAFTFSPDVPAYYTNMKSAKCDAQGNFVFERVADGEFFVTVAISWEVANQQQGGNIMQRVSLSGGKTENVILAP